MLRRHRDTPALLLAFLLFLWAGLGLGHTSLAMLGDSGWRPVETEDTRLTLGLPDTAHAPMVAAVRRLLAPHSFAHVTVVVPPGTEQSQVDYLRYQLAHLEYPTRISVVRAADWTALQTNSQSDSVVVLTPGVATGDVGETADYRLIRPGSR